LLLNPPYLAHYSRSQRSPAVTKSGTLYYPIWLAYAAGLLEDNGFKVGLLDAPASGFSWRDVLRRAALFRPELIVLDSTTPSIESDLQIAGALKHALPAATVVMVGTHVSALPEETLRRSASLDAVARGEYDETVLELATCLEQARDWQRIAGITYRAAGGRIVRNADRPLMPALDHLPFVSRVYKTHLPVERYFYAITQRPVVAIIGGRGCPYRCTFCVYPQVMHGHDYRTRAVESLVDEMAYIRRALPQVREVFIEDDTFTLDAGRVEAFCRGLLGARVRLAWTCNARADMDTSLLPLMRRAGNRMLCVGFENADRGVLRGMHKGLAAETMLRFSAAARKAGVSVHGCFLIGGSGETADSAQRTLDLAKRLNPQTAQFYPLMVYPGTTAYQRAERDGLLLTHDFREWLTPEGGHRSVLKNTVFPHSSLEQFCATARRRFYLRPAYLRMRLLHTVRHPREARSLVHALRRFVPHLLGRRAQRRVAGGRASS
jgi:radical SAM superfamily enzyme YgiQ (UPF0313 family)